MEPRRQAAWEDAIAHVPVPLSWETHVKQRTEGFDEAIARLNGAPRPLRLGTPCAGFEAPVFALRQLGVKNFVHTFSVDIARHAASFCTNLRQGMGEEGHRPGRAWLGPRDGDLLRIPCADLPSVDIIIAGPPCPPWSLQGRREGRDDPRAEVFWKVVEIIGELSCRPYEDALQCFILENVDGIMMEDSFRRRGIDEVLERLRTAVPTFKIRILKMNSRNYSLPQNRPRVYIIGVRQNLVRPGRALCSPKQHPPPPLFSEWMIPASEALKELFEIPDRLVNKKFKWDEQLEALDDRAYRRGQRFGWLAACANIERDVDKNWSTKVKKDGYVGTFTTQNPLWLWVRRGMVASTGNERPPPVSEAEQRYLMEVEALAMQGFPVRDSLLTRALQGLSDADVLFGAGNAMSVSVVGAILADVFAKTNLGSACPFPVPSILVEDSCESVDEDDDTIKPNSNQKRLRTFGNTSQGLRNSEAALSEDSSLTNGLQRKFECGCWLHLRCTDVSLEQRVMHIRRASFLVGRDPLRVPPEGLLSDPAVSRVHAEIRRCGPISDASHDRTCAAYLFDHGSSCGTTVKGKGCIPKGEAFPISKGDLICFGACEQDGQQGQWYLVDVSS